MTEVALPYLNRRLMKSMPVFRVDKRYLYTQREVVTHKVLCVEIVAHCIPALNALHPCGFAQQKQGEYFGVLVADTKNHPRASVIRVRVGI